MAKVVRLIGVGLAVLGLGVGIGATWAEISGGLRGVWGRVGLAGGGTEGATTRATTRATRLATTGGLEGVASEGINRWLVRRGDLRIVFTERGQLRAAKSYRIVPQISGQIKITFLAAEGATVKKGDRIAAFDTKAYEERLTALRASLEDAKRQLTVTESLLVIAVSTAKTSEATAKTKLEDAQIALKTYSEMEGPKRLSEVDKLLSETRTKLTEAQKQVSDASRQLDDGLFSEEDQKKRLEAELAERRVQVRTFERSMEALKVQRKTFRAYEYPQAMKAKRQAVESAGLEVDRSKVAGTNDVSAKAAEVEKVKGLIRRTESAIKDTTESIGMCELTAPTDGLVIYGDPSGRSYYGRVIQVGGDWYGGQTLLTIPDLSEFKVDLSLGESMMGKVRAGMAVVMRFDAVPGLAVEGDIEEIAKLGSPRESYDPSSTKVFPTVVRMKNSDVRLVSGMSTKVEILADELRGVVVVPVDAIATEGGNAFVRVSTGSGGRVEKRAVVTGRSNNSLVEVVSGLAEGEQVVLGEEGAALGEGAAGTGGAGGSGRGGGN